MLHIQVYGEHVLVQSHLLAKSLVKVSIVSIILLTMYQEITEAKRCTQNHGYGHCLQFHMPTITQTESHHWSLSYVQTGSSSSGSQIMVFHITVHPRTFQCLVHLDEDCQSTEQTTLHFSFSGFHATVIHIPST